MSRIDFSKWPAQAEDTQPGASQEGQKVPYLDIFGEDEPTDYLFYLKDSSGRKCGYIARANLHTLQGAPKEGKSAAGLALITAALKGDFLGITPSRPDLRVLWIDTEQDRNTLRQKARAALSMAGIDTQPDRLKVVALRGFGSKAELLRATGQAIAENAPDFVLVDGAVDLCEAFNDPEKSEAVVLALLNLTELHDCAILAVIHTNKTKPDEARGHLGSILQEKSAEIYQVNKTGISARVHQVRTRFAGVPDWGYSFADDFKIEPTAALVDKTREAMRTRFAPLFQGGARVMKGRLIELYTEAQGCGESKAEKDIKAATDAGILFVEHEGRCAFYSYLFPPLDDEAEEAL